MSTITETEESAMFAKDLVSAALVQCQGELKAAEFDATNPFFKSKYATLGAIIAASRQALAKSGLAILQKPTIEGHLVSVHTAIIHKSGQSLDCGVMSLSLGESDRNSDAQLAGSIITYLRRYSWASVLGIYADTDDDGNSGPRGAVPRKPPIAQNAPGSVGSPKPPSVDPQPIKTPPSASQTPFQPPPGPSGRPLNMEKCRMKALNTLQAAPGQRNRVLVTDYLEHKGWITRDQVAEDWSVEHVPTSVEAMATIVEELEKFEMSQREQNQGVIP